MMFETSLSTHRLVRDFLIFLDPAAIEFEDSVRFAVRLCNIIGYVVSVMLYRSLMIPAYIPLPEAWEDLNELGLYSVHSLIQERRNSNFRFRLRPEVLFLRTVCTPRVACKSVHASWNALTTMYLDTSDGLNYILIYFRLYLIYFRELLIYRFREYFLSILYNININN